MGPLAILAGLVVIGVIALIWVSGDDEAGHYSGGFAGGGGFDGGDGGDGGGGM